MSFGVQETMEKASGRRKWLNSIFGRLFELVLLKESPEEENGSYLYYLAYTIKTNWHSLLLFYFAKPC